MAYNHEKGWCWVGHKEKIIFIGIPKNASTSIRNSFGFKASEPDNYFSIQKRVTDERNYKTLTVLRNPLDRFISGYIEVCKRATGDSPKTLEKQFYWMRNSKRRFLAFLDEIELDFFDAHIEPQEHYLTDYNGKFIHCDFYLIMENLEEEFRNMCRKLNIDIPLRFDNVISFKEKNIIIELFKKLNRISIKSYFIRDTKNLLDKVNHRIFQSFCLDNRVHFRQPIPNKKEVFNYLEEDKSLVIHKPSTFSGGPG